MTKSKAFVPMNLYTFTDLLPCGAAIFLYSLISVEN